MKFQLKEFTDGPANGMKFNVPVFESVAEAAAHYGEENSLKFINNGIVNLVRAKVKPPKFADVTAAAEHRSKLVTKFPDSVIFSETDATNFRPFERELTEGGLIKAIQETKKALAAAKTAGDEAAIEAAKAKLDELINLYTDL